MATTEAAELIGDLRELGVILLVDETGTLRARGAKGTLTPALMDLVRAQREAITAVLVEEERVIAWRVAAMLARIGPDGALPADVVVGEWERQPGRCYSCGEPQPYGQDGKCTLCALAAGRIVFGGVRNAGDIAQQPAA